jgi:hypothetical protein
MEADMTDPKKPLTSDRTDEDVADPTETEALVDVPVEGPLPGMPVATDPLLNPSPHPRKRQVPPLD